MLLPSVICSLIRLDVLAVVIVTRILRIVLATIAVQILAANNATNLVVMLTPCCLRRLLICIPPYLDNYPVFSLLNADPELLRHDLRVLLRSRVLTRMQLPVKPNSWPNANFPTV